MNNNLVQTKRSWRTFWRDAGKMLRLAWQARPRFSLVAILLSLVQAQLPVAAAWLLKLLLDAVVVYCNCLLNSKRDALAYLFPTVSARSSWRM
jgi:hypothetical protein